MPMDGNIERVLARLEAFDEPLPKGAGTLRKLAQAYVMGAKTGHLAQAFMDLSARHCGANSTDCSSCPLQDLCPVQGPGALGLPLKQAKKPPEEVTWHLLVTHDHTHVVLERRSEGGIMAGMLGFPVVDVPPLGSDYAGSITHRLTHRLITAHVHLQHMDNNMGGTEGRITMDRDEHTLKQLPTLMRKAAERSGLFTRQS
jgi:A/G-specific DNA glycosylase